MMMVKRDVRRIGMKRSANTSIMQARKIEAHASRSPAMSGDWFYWVAPRDLRNHSRLKTRLRSGKLLDADRNFLSEYVVRDVSPTGLRVHFARTIIMPVNGFIFDDSTLKLSAIRMVWNQSGESGLLLCDDPLSSSGQRRSFTICYAA